LAVNKVIYDGETLIDLTEDTVTEETLDESATAHDASGTKITGKRKKGEMPVAEQLPSADESNYGTFILLSNEDGDVIYACVKKDGVYQWQEIDDKNYGAENAGKLLYVNDNGDVVVLGVGNGLKIDKENMLIYATAADKDSNEFTATLNKAKLGKMILGKADNAANVIVGIKSIEQTFTSDEDGGTNEITAILTNGTSQVFYVKNGNKGSQGIQGEKGADGKDGINGTNGKDGANGVDGKDGTDGKDGKTAYEYAKDGGYTGTEAEFSAKLAKESTTEKWVFELTDGTIITKDVAIG
jgi:hypothetical protein